VAAGADMYLVCHSEELVQRASDAIRKEAERSRRFRAVVETAARRILAAKKRRPELSGKLPPPPSEAAVNHLRQQSWLFGEAVRLATNARPPVKS
jgi:beta-glucosidase-like glycosyl hydrolase